MIYWEKDADVEENNENSTFIEDIINGMFDWVRVIDRQDNIVYINNSMAQAFHPSIKGKKCYAALGRTEPCDNCISRQTVFEGNPHEKEEIINGRVFSVMSSPVKNRKGQIVYVVEVLRDITQMKQLQSEIIEQNHKLQSNLSMAKRLQCSLLPKGLPENKIDFSFVYKPCEDLGGDFLDIFSIDEDRIGIYIADVSGHGVPASMLTVFLRSAMNKKLVSPAQALEQLYTEFNNSQFDHDLYITVFYAVIDLKQQKLIFSNAGHNVCPVLFNTGRFEILRSSGIPISNWLKKPGYCDSAMDLIQGDRIFFYTDGIVELRNSSGEQYGEKRLLDILLEDNTGISNSLNRIVESACEFADIGDTLQIPDDITMALLEIK